MFQIVCKVENGALAHRDVSSQPPSRFVARRRTSSYHQTCSLLIAHILIRVDYRILMLQKRGAENARSGKFEERNMQ